MVLLMVFTACSGNNDDAQEGSTFSGVATEDAKIKEADAVRFIEQSYTEEELGLDKTDKDYSMMVSSSGIDIDGVKYVKVVANVITKKDVTAEDGSDTFSMETIGEYFISFDGDKVLKRDMETGEYTELENRYEAYKEKGSTTTAEEHTHSDDETTKG